LTELKDHSRCVTSVYLTSGDAGLGLPYAAGRETGSKEAYSVKVKNGAIPSSDSTWTTTTGFLANQRVVLESYNGNPNVQHVWLRIPDGNYLGDGFPATNSMSLKKLYSGQIQTIQTLPIVLPLTSPSRRDPMDASSSSYNLDGLRQAISEMVALTKPVVVRTQDWQGEGRSDHSDHYTTAKIVHEVVGSQGINIVG
jgi:hypothetical protein